MFSPDNFYDVICSMYGNFKTPNYICLPEHHGSKNWFKFRHHPTIKKEKLHYWVALDDTFGKIIMHDQESVDVFYSADIYKSSGTYVKKNSETNPSLSDSLSDEMLLQNLIKSDRIPILCHSEINSVDILTLEKNLFIGCYYWWHGMIARDWFRHWEHHGDFDKIDFTNRSYRFLVYSRDFSGTRKYRKSILNYLKKYQSEISFDWDNKEQKPSTLSAYIDVEDANNSSIHLICETLFETEKIHLTEKIFKPIVMNQPFFLFSSAGSLQYLKKYGFKTFDGIWDESYDQEKNHQIRMAMIFLEIEKLMNLSRKEFDLLCNRCRPIIEHNRQWFFNQKFQTLLINEMKNSFSSALEKQEYQTEIYPGGSWFWVMNKIIEKKCFPIEERNQYTRNKFSCHDTLTQQMILKKYPKLLPVLTNTI
jgi:hypothetical protein